MYINSKLSTNKVQRRSWFDFLRGVAILMVVGIHTYPDGLRPDGGLCEISQIVFRNLLNCAVPIFLAISGLFIGQKPLASWAERSRFWRKQLPTVYVPCLIYSLPWLFLASYFHHREGISFGGGYYVVYQLLNVRIWRLLFHCFDNGMLYTHTNFDQTPNHRIFDCSYCPIRTYYGRLRVVAICQWSVSPAKCLWIVPSTTDFLLFRYIFFKSRPRLLSMDSTWTHSSWPCHRNYAGAVSVQSFRHWSIWSKTWSLPI